MDTIHTIGWMRIWSWNGGPTILLYWCDSGTKTADFGQEFVTIGL